MTVQTRQQAIAGDMEQFEAQYNHARSTWSVWDKDARAFLHHTPLTFAGALYFANEENQRAKETGARRGAAPCDDGNGREQKYKRAYEHCRAALAYIARAGGDQETREYALARVAEAVEMLSEKET